MTTDGDRGADERPARVPSRILRRVEQPLSRGATAGLLFIVLLVLSGLRVPGFFASGNLGGSIGEAAPLVLSVLAITPIAISAPAGIDLAIGPLVVFVNVTVVQWLVPHGFTNEIEIFAFAIALAVGFELIQGLIINVVRLQPIIVTLSGYLVLGGLNLVVLPQAGGTVPGWLGNLGAPSSLLSPALYVLVGCYALWAALSRTTFLRNLRLVGGNERAGYVAGMRLVPTRLGAHVLAGIYAGVAGVFLTGLLQSADPTAGSSETLMAVTALVVGGVSLAGGRGGALGALLGALDIFLIGDVLGTFQLGEGSSYATEATYGVVLVAALLLGYLTDKRLRQRQARDGRLAADAGSRARGDALSGPVQAGAGDEHVVMGL